MSIASPVGAGLTQGRTDQGVDYSGAGPLYAVGSGTIVNLYNQGWPGGTFIALKLDQAAGLPSSVVYYAENITPSVQIGQRVKAGDVIGHATGGPSGIEIGWADPNAIGAALAHGAAGATTLGQDFANRIKGAAVSNTTTTTYTAAQAQASFAQAQSISQQLGLTVNEFIAMGYFIGQGLSPAAAAGIVGNLMAESGVNPESVQPGGPGRGIAQWSQGGRWQPQLMTGNAQVDLVNQLQFIWTELQGPYSSTLQALQTPGIAPNMAAWVFANKYEQCAACNNANSGDVTNRVNNANSVYNKTGGGASLTSSGGSGGWQNWLGDLSPLYGFITGKGVFGAASGGILSGLDAIGAFFNSLGGFVKDLTSAQFWQRIGIFVLGGALVIGGVAMFFSTTKTGQHVVSEAEQAGAVAALA